MTVWSKTCSEFWYEPENILRVGMPMIELLRHIAQCGGFGSGDIDTLAERELARIRHAGPNSDDEFRMLDGRVIRVCRNAVAGGGHASSYIDVTRYHDDQDTLRARLADYRLAASISSVGHWLWDETSQKMVSCSDQCANIHGLSVSEYMLVSGTLEGEIAWAHPDDRGRYRAALLSGTDYDIEYRIVRKDGEVRHVREISEVEYDGSGRAVRSRGIVQDVTDLVDTRNALTASEQRYREIFEDAPIALWVEDFSKVKAFVDDLAKKGHSDLRTYFSDNPDKLHDAYNLTETLETSRASLDLYGVENKDQYIRYLSAEYALPSELEAFVDILVGFTEGQWTFECESEDTTWFEGEGNIIVLTKGVVPDAYRHDWSRVIYSMEDVTEMRKTQANLQIAMRKAEQASATKTAFLANMSHELRTPLNAIIGYSDAISQEVFGVIGNPKYREYVNDINISGRHLLGLVNSILDLSKVEAGAESVTETDIDVAALVNACLPLVTGYDRRETVGIAVRIPENLPDLRADERQLKQILINLLTNAVKYNREDGAVTVSASVDDAGAFVIEVADDGPGIAAVDIPKVLEPFGQATSGGRKRMQGTGLGLPLAKRLTELHGGALHLESEPGAGTTVQIRFPPERTARNG